MIRVRTGIIKWPGERNLPNNMNSGLNRTMISFFQNNFLRAFQLEPWGREINKCNPITGN